MNCYNFFCELLNNAKNEVILEVQPFHVYIMNFGALLEYANKLVPPIYKMDRITKSQ